MGVPLYDEDGTPVTGVPIRPKLSPDERRRQMLASLAKGRGMRRNPRVTVEIKQFLQRILDDRMYRACFRRRMLSGEIAPQLEAMVYHYVIGKPKETHEFTATVGVTTVSLDRLTDQQLHVMRDLLQGLHADAVEQILDADAPALTAAESDADAPE